MVADPPEVSVVIPCRDGWPEVRRAARAALDQQRVTVEVIVVDDGSSAPLRGPLEKALDNDARLRFVRLDRAVGVASARNAGLERARATWSACLDHDDVWSPEKLRRQLDAVDAADADWAYAAALVLDGRFRPVGLEEAPAAHAVRRLLRRRSCIPGGGSGVLARTDLMLGLGGFDPAFAVMADWDMWLRLADRPAAALVEPLVAFVRRDDGMSVRQGDKVFEELRRLDEKHREVPLDVDIGWLARWTAGSQRRGGRRVDAARTYLAGARRGDFPGGVLRALLALVEPHRPSGTARGIRHPPSAPEWVSTLTQ